MIPGYDDRRIRRQLRIWWIIWVGSLLGLLAIYLLLGRGKPPQLPVSSHPLTGLAGFVPLFVSIIIRWLVLPRCHGLKQALPLFVTGLILAEACGVLGIFLGGVYKDDLVLLGVLGLGQFVPFFARWLSEPKPQGYIPNN